MSELDEARKIITPFFHPSVADYMEDVVMSSKVLFLIAPPRKTKLGDYRALPERNVFVITVNENLNPVQFLITVLHELAHHATWLKHKNHVKPHGKEWKQEYQRVFMPILMNENVDEALKKVFAQHLKNPKATSYSDRHLNEYLNATFEIDVKRVHDIPLNEPFRLGNRTFVKEKKLRTRYVCLDMADKKKYLIHGHTELK